MSAHTPGPWVTDGVSSEGGWEIWTAAEPQYSTVICSRNDWPHRAAESRANARLIAAAPTLLAELRNARGAIASLDVGALGRDALLHDIDAAIALATSPHPPATGEG